MEHGEGRGGGGGAQRLMQGTEWEARAVAREESASEMEWAARRSNAE